MIISADVTDEFEKKEMMKKRLHAKKTGIIY